MSDEWEALGREVINDLKATGAEFWERLSADQLPIVKQAVRDLTRYVMLAAQKPEERERHLRSIRHIRGTLESEAALAALRARKRIKDAILRTIYKAAQVGLSLL